MQDVSALLDFWFMAIFIFYSDLCLDLNDVFLFYFFSEQSCVGEAREGQSRGKLPYTNGSFWTVRREGKIKGKGLFEGMCAAEILSHVNNEHNLSLLDFRIGLNRDPRKSQPANREEDHCQSKLL